MYNTNGSLKFILSQVITHDNMSAAGSERNNSNSSYSSSSDNNSNSYNNKSKQREGN